MALTQIQPNLLDSANNYTVNNLNVTGNVTVTGNVVATGNVTTAGNLNGTIGTLSNVSFSGFTTLSQTTEVLSSKSGATGIVVHDLSGGTTFYHSTVAANFTANFTNVPTTQNRTIVVVLIIAQGATPYYANAVQINSVAQTVNWVNSIVPTATANKKEIVSFTLINVSGSWTVTGSLSSFG